MKDARVPFLLQKNIEEETEVLIERYTRAHNLDVKPPIPIEDIIEKHLKLLIEFDDLAKDNACGAIYPDGSISIDNKLDPEKYPLQEGRYHFTLAHEVGHWTLHQRLLNQGPRQLSLLDTSGNPAFICREIDIYPKPKKIAPEEWQANTFAAYLLMPYKLVLAARSGLGSNLCPETLCAALAERFAVSRAGMRIRLEELSLLHEGANPQQSLAFQTT